MNVRLFPVGDERTVADVLARAGEDVAAVSDGRVFVRGVRVREATRAVAIDDEILVERPRDVPAGVRVVAERDGLLAAFKPAGLPTEPDRRGDASLVHELARLIGEAPGSLHATTRLDAMVSGIVVVARGTPGKRRAAALVAEGALHRTYVAIAGAAPSPRVGTWEAPIGRGPRGTWQIGGREARDACTRYRTGRVAPRAIGGVAPAVLALSPVTGRTHQLRLHAALAGAALLGDAAHGGARRLVLADGGVLSLPRVALHAGRVRVDDGRAPPWIVTEPAPQDLALVWEALGGTRPDLDEALGEEP